MAWFTYKCPQHGEFRVNLERRVKILVCKQCSQDCTPVLRAGTTRVVERLDNGVMGRAVERLHNIEEIMDERNKKFTVKQDEEEDA